MTASATPPDVAQQEFDAAVEYFRANRKAITAQYAGRYVAILNGDVVDSDPERAALSRRMYERYGLRPLYMPYVDPSGEDNQPRIEWRPGMILR